MDFNKKELLRLLKENEYSVHPHFGCYHNPKKQIGYMFYVTDNEVTVYKVKWKQIDLGQTVRTFRIKLFNPNQYDLRDKQAELIRQQNFRAQQMLRQKKREKIKLDKTQKEVVIDDGNNLQIEELT